MCKCAITGVLLDNAHSEPLKLINERYTERYINQMIKEGGDTYFTMPSKRLLSFIEKGAFSNDLSTDIFNDGACYFCKGLQYDVMTVFKDENDKLESVFHKQLFEFNIPQKNFKVLYPKGKICDECLYIIKTFVDEDLGGFEFTPCSECGEDYLIDPDSLSVKMYTQTEKGSICDDCLRSSMAESYYNRQEEKVVFGDLYEQSILCYSCNNISLFDRTIPKEFDMLFEINSRGREYYCSSCVNPHETERDEELPFDERSVDYDPPKSPSEMDDTEEKVTPMGQPLKEFDNYLDFKPDEKWFINLRSYQREGKWWLTYNIVTLKKNGHDLEMDEIIFNGARTVMVYYSSNDDLTDIIETAYEHARTLKDTQKESQKELNLDEVLYD